MAQDVEQYDSPSADALDTDAEKRTAVTRRLAERQTETPAPPRRPKKARLVGWAAWLYVAGVVAVWGLLLGGDRWWFPTVILFSPRWLYALPLAPLVPAALLWRPKMLWPLTVAGLIAVWPIMGLCLPWGRLAAGGESGAAFRVLTCNVQHQNVDATALAELVAQTQPDVIALQECVPAYPTDWLADWNVRRAGNLLIASRHPIRDVEWHLRSYPPSRWPGTHALRCVIETPQGPVPFCNLHLHSPRAGLEEVLDGQTVVNFRNGHELQQHIEIRRRESEELTAWLEDAGDLLVLAGDFNMPTDGAIYRRRWAAYTNAFSSVGFGYGYTKWSQKRWFRYGLRIDHVLIGPEWTVESCWVGSDVGSDHLPLLADVCRSGTDDPE